MNLYVTPCLNLVPCRQPQHQIEKLGLDAQLEIAFVPIPVFTRRADVVASEIVPEILQRRLSRFEARADSSPAGEIVGGIGRKDAAPIQKIEPGIPSGLRDFNVRSDAAASGQRAALVRVHDA